MSQTFVWDKSTYLAAISSRCWWFTPYDAGWDDSQKYGRDLRQDEELREIVALEWSLRPLPEWVHAVVRRPIQHVGPCGHYRFPLSFLDAVDAIGRQHPPEMHHACYTVDKERKHRAQDYALCLDAWLAGAKPEEVAPELQAHGAAGVDWPTVCRDLWRILGARSELKDLLVERLLLGLRWYIKFTIWDDDRGDRFGRDQFLGTWEPSDSIVTGNGNPQLSKGAVRLSRSPRVKSIETRIRELTPHAPWFLTVVGEFQWLCAPKAFRFLEKTLWCIGKEEPRIHLPSFPLVQPDEVPGFLQCEDTRLDPRQTAGWWEDFLAALDAWGREQPPGTDVAKDVFARLGATTPVKRWLVRLFALRCCRLAEWDSLHKLTKSATSA